MIKIVYGNDNLCILLYYYINQVFPGLMTAAYKTNCTLMVDSRGFPTFCCQIWTDISNLNLDSSPTPPDL